MMKEDLKTHKRNTTSPKTNRWAGVAWNEHQGFALLRSGAQCPAHSVRHAGYSLQKDLRSLDPLPSCLQPFSLQEENFKTRVPFLQGGVSIYGRSRIMESKDNVLYFHSLEWVVSFECVRKRITPNGGESQSHQQLFFTLLCCCSDFSQRALPSQSLCSPHRLRMLTGTFLLLLGNTQSWAPTGTNYNHGSKNWRQQPSLGSYFRICRISWAIPPTKSQKSRSSDTIALSLLNTGGTTK